MTTQQRITQVQSIIDQLHGDIASYRTSYKSEPQFSIKKLGFARRRLNTLINQL